MIDLKPLLGTKAYHPIREIIEQILSLKEENEALKIRLSAIESRKKPGPKAKK